MSHKTSKLMPARTSPGMAQTRSAPSSLPLGGGEKLAMGAPQLRLRVGSVNVGSLTGRSGEVADMCERRCLDFCCLQETRWKGGSAKLLGKNKIFWTGCKEGTAGVGVVVAEKWVESVIEVRRISERLMVLRVIVGKAVLNLISAYAPQVGRAMEDKEEFFVSLGRLVSDVGVGERVIIGSDLNGHVGADVDGFEGVHGGHGFGARNVEGEMVLEYADALDLVVVNTWFEKDEGKLVTYESGGSRTVMDYILTRRSERKLVRNVSVIRGESCITQHKLLVCVLDWGRNVRKKREVFVSRCKVWKLKEVEIRNRFQQGVLSRAATRKDEEGVDVDVLWGGLKDCLLDVAEEVCGKTKGPQRHSETWWWNSEVAVVVKEKQRLYGIYDKSKRGPDKTDLEENKRLYDIAKAAAKKAVEKAKEEARKRLGEDLDNGDKKGSVFRVAKQIVKKNRDVVGGGCVKDVDGKSVVEEEKLLEVWRRYYDKLSNEEFS